MEAYKEKALHGQYEKLTVGKRNIDSWTWLRKGTSKKEMEGMIIAAQDQALRKNVIKSRIDNKMFHLCVECEESTKKRSPMY